MLLIILTYLSLFFNTTISYLLCLAFLGVSKPFTKLIFPVLIMASIVFISRVGFQFPGEINSLISLTTCLLLVKAFNREVSWLLTALSTLLSLIVLLFGGLLWPLCYHLFGVYPTKTGPYTWGWLYICLAEAIVPFVVLVILKIKRISLIKYLAK
ncbi:MAG: hypothetical protein K6U80_12610 [Firmicutes bacterium]|nr:hypothetical protein [Bacillota bacterium]